MRAFSTARGVLFSALACSHAKKQPIALEQGGAFGGVKPQVGMRFLSALKSGGLRQERLLLDQ